MEFKKNYTAEEIAEVREWLMARQDKFPKTLELLPGMTITDVSAAVKRYFALYDFNKGGEVYQGQFSHLFVLREKMQEMGID